MLVVTRSALPFRVALLSSALLVACGQLTITDKDGGPRVRVDAGPPSESCESVRLTSYQPFAQGWCEFDTTHSFLPQLVRDGLTGAIAEPWNGSSYRGQPGEGCGECWEIDTVNDTQIVMITDLCPEEGNTLCQGSHFHIDLTETAARIVGGGALDEGQARRVPCPVTGNVHVLVNDENVTYLRVAFLNHRIPVRSVEFRGAGAGVTEPNEWTPLQRSGGAWEVIGGGRPTDRGGQGVVFRLTSAQGQVVESTAIVPSHPPRGTTVDLGVQFDDRMPPVGGSCEFVPPGDIFTDGFGGIDQVRWQIDPWGQAERGFFGETTEGCASGSCLVLETMAQYDGFHLYYRQPFPTSTFRSVRGRLRTRTGTTQINVTGTHDGMPCTGSQLVDVGPDWVDFELDVTSSCANLPRLNALTMGNAGGQIALLLDDVRFVR